MPATPRECTSMAKRGNRDAATATVPNDACKPLTEHTL